MKDMIVQPKAASQVSRLRRLRWLWMLLGCILIISGILCVVELCRIGIRSHRHARYYGVNQAISNLRQVGLALLEFDEAYGGLPDNSMIQKPEVGDSGASASPGGFFSNDYFRLLITAGIVPNESMFYVRSPRTHRPDEITEGKKALEKGECSFAYIHGLSLSTDMPNTPMAIFPLVRGKHVFDFEFCKQSCAGKAVILFLDNSVKTFPVDESGHVWINGKDLFDPSQPFWSGKVPEVKWPE